MVKLQLVRESSVPAAERLVESPDVAAGLVRSYIGDPDREHLVVIFLDRRNQVLGLQTVSIGSLSDTSAEPREIFKAAILMNAAAIVLAHNHPSGNPEPSPRDVALTRTIREAGQLLGVELLDHIILGSPEWVSCRDRGLGGFPPAFDRTRTASGFAAERSHAAEMVESLRQSGAPQVLASRVANSLASADFRSIVDAARLPDNELLRVRGLGTAGLNEIRRCVPTASPPVPAGGRSQE